MPLMSGKSKKAFSKNVATEMEAGKPQAQSLAIAYSMKKKNAKKMAYGGMAEADKEPHMDIPAPSTSMGPAMDEYEADHFAKGGEVEAHELMGDDERAGSIADAIMRKRKVKAMADGGMVDLEAASEESPNMADEDNYDAIKKEQYDLDQLSDDPMDSNEHGHAMEDERDMISKIRSKIRSKRGM